MNGIGNGIQIGLPMCDNRFVWQRNVPDALWPTDNEYGIPLLNPRFQATELQLPVTKWGTVARTKNAHAMPGTWHFYTEDYKFQALWRDPSPIVRSECHAVIEPNFSTNEQMPFAVALWRVYMKRWLARWWQQYGICVLVDMFIDPLFQDLALLGVPQGWRAYATHVLASQLEIADNEYRAACERAGTDDILFVAYGGRDTLGCEIRQRGWVWVPENSVEARDG